MDDKDLLLKQISLGEDSTLELKEIEYKSNSITGPHRNSMADEMAAMANSHGGTIVLGVNDKTHEVTGIPDVLARLFQQRSQNRLIRFDEQIVLSANFDILEKTLWERFKTPLSPQNDKEFLEKLKLVSYNDDGVLHPTISGILIACESPEQYISNAYIQAVCYQGDDRNTAQLDAQDIFGSLDMQIKEACKFVKRNMKIRAIKDPGRIETPQYSLNAVFEAIVNAVAHRDYSIYGSKIRLHIFSDRLELYSPGSIPNSMTIDSLSLRQSSRNELLSSLLARCPMNFDATGSKRLFIMDKRGEGVPIIISESMELSGKKPVYSLIDDSELILTIFSAF